MPVIISNLRSNDQYVNNPFTYAKSQMVSRFFVTEKISGINIAGGYNNGNSPNYIRVAQTIKLTVQLDPTSKEHI